MGIAVRVASRLSAVGARTADRVKRPAGMVESTRWLLALMALGSLAFGLLAPLAEGSALLLVIAVASTAALAASCTVGYLLRGAPWIADVVDAIAILAFALASPHPSTAARIVFALLWFRCLYGSTRRAVQRCCLYVGALAGSVALWEYAPTHLAAIDLGPLLGVVPTMFLTVVVVRLLSKSLGARERAEEREAIHARLGTDLLGQTDEAQIRRVAWLAMTDICAVFPGLRVLKVNRNGELLHVDGASGEFEALPQCLTPGSLAFPGRDTGTASITESGRAQLDAGVGAHCAWSCLPLTGVNGGRGPGWLLLGSPGSVAAEAVVSISTVANQVTLAMRSSEVHQELTVQATIDSLTGLANRMALNTAISASLGGPERETTVLFVDLDDFKDVNDKFGHGSGDQVLREVAARLRQATRPQDMCARLGGDEFAILLRDTGVAMATDVAQRIVRSVGAPTRVSGGVARIGASIGVATATSESSLEQLVHRADIAMYAAKANGKACVQVFQPGLLQVDSAQVSFERQLMAATRNGELLVHYQPVVSLADGRCTAVEALVRWRNPERGLLYPNAFIPTAERIGAIQDIGAYVLRRACSDASAWRDAHPGAPLAVHVNVSALQLDDERFVDRVTRCLHDFAMQPHELVLEITETVVISTPAAIERVQALSALGVAIAIDDFGTGYSALTTLRSLPVQIVKIDKSFIAGSTLNAEDRAVTEAVVKMATQMGLHTVAEGVESLAQHAFVQRIGANSAQGFFYLRPASAADFGSWLDQNLARSYQASSGNVVSLLDRRLA